MRSLLMLATVFALLVGYLETTMVKAPDSVQLKTVSSVIRTPVLVKPPQPAPVEAVIAVIARQENDVATPAKRPLNLKLPTIDQIKQRYSARFARKTQQNPMNLFRREDTQEISYSAELVYDAERGENITGGKVNIRIPLG
ncbi:MAG: hypothetical protein V7459_17230 [Oceanicoccus sp.]